MNIKSKLLVLFSQYNFDFGFSKAYTSVKKK